MAAANLALPDSQEDLLPRRVPVSGERPGPARRPHRPPRRILHTSFRIPLGGSGDVPWVAVLGGGLGCFEEGARPSFPGICPQMTKRREGREGHSPPTPPNRDHSESLRLLSPGTTWTSPRPSPRASHPSVPRALRAVCSGSVVM